MGGPFLTSKSDPKIILVPHSVYSANGKLQGTIQAFDLDGKYLTECHSNNWSSPKEREKAAEEFAEWTAQPIQDCRIAMNSAMEAARKAEKEQRDIEENTPRPAPLIHDRPTIYVIGQPLRESVSKSWDAIKAANRPEPRFFNRNGEMAELRRNDETSVPYSFALTKDGLRGHLDRAIDFMKRTASDGETHVLPPPWVAADMLEFSVPPLPTLYGVRTSPYMAVDGSIVTQSGYDEQSGYYLHLGDMEMPEVALQPSVDDLAEAVDLISGELLVDFAFEGPADECHAIAALMNPVIRPLINGPTPFFIFEAPGPGTGKTYLAEVITAVSAAGNGFMTNAPFGDDEWRKLLITALKTSPAVIVFDNISVKLNSSTFCLVLTTSEPWKTRDLGGTKDLTLSVNTTWIGTGNNPEMSEEVTRRTVRSRQDARVEDPSARDDWRHPDLMGWAKTNRPRLLWSIFTLVRAWMAAGRPPGDVTMGSYDQWAKTVGGILGNAGYTGFLGNRSDLYRDSARERNDTTAFVHRWWDLYAGEPVPASTLIEMSTRENLLLEARAGKTGHAALVRIGRLLAQSRGQIFDGIRVGSGPPDRFTKSNTWKLEKVES
ncbi:hypothetical protein LCGC14_0595000 [marine sediment metagenome]|uniref:Uncharacterized protein n=1 Tax=marine sediment metagenome TaxID=412755 RepID=A0A0F9TYD6_9ZZZZ